MTIYTAYQPDILGLTYQFTELRFPNDYEGKVIATLIRKQAPQKTKKAVLYIHGFIDYFFQTEMAEQFNQFGFDFYALDLRKYGRSHLKHQKFYNVRNLSEYDAEIIQALQIIENEGHDTVVLAGHSTGGLISTLFVNQYLNHPLLKALWLNSPFFDFNLSPLEKKYALPLLSQLGEKFPTINFPNRVNSWYVPSLHKIYYGEWNFNLEWKKKEVPTVPLGFIHAIYQAHQVIHQGPYLNTPTLIMYSSQSSSPKHWNESAQNSDIILNIKDIKKYGHRLKGPITLCEIKNGIHDLVLSAPETRKTVYNELFQWLKLQHLI